MDYKGIGSKIVIGTALSLPVAEYIELSHGDLLNPHSHHEESARPLIRQGQIDATSSTTSVAYIDLSKFTY